MKVFKRTPALIICAVFLLGSVLIILKIRDYTQDFKLEKNKIVSLLNFNERLLDVKEAIPLYGDWVWENKYKEYQYELERADEHYAASLSWAMILVLINVFMLLLLIFIYAKSSRWFGVSMGLLTFSLSMLLTGLFTPLLELEAYKENLEIKIEVDAEVMLKDIQSAVASIPLIGSASSAYIDDLLPGFEGERYKWEKVYPDKMYFFYENKGLFDVLQTLWASGNIPIAIIVGLFSFVVPAFKMMFSFLILLSPAGRLNRWRKIVNYLTKFSMLDVMVVSIFLTFFTFDELSTGVETSSKLLMGIYFFTSYVVLALISGLTIDKYHDHRLATMKKDELLT
jgi:paraquat-inducible protein A